MGREQVAGAIVLDRLRDRIISGLYLGLWESGDRLPSIRTIAAREGVDRKTAAAAYRRLEEEGIVEVRPRSGVYLRPLPKPEPPGPMERLYRRWLEHTYTGARELGLDTSAIRTLIEAVAEIERLRIPVIECNWAQAEAIAHELRDRLGVHAVPYLLDEVHPDEPLLAEAPVLVSTPYHRSELKLLPAARRRVIEITSSPAVLETLREHLRTARVTVVTANRPLAAKVRRALRHGGLLPDGDEAKHHVVAVDEQSSLADAMRDASHAFLWPGTPESVEEALPPDVEPVRPPRSISQDAVRRVQTAILDAAVRHVTELQQPQEVRAL